MGPAEAVRDVAAEGSLSGPPEGLIRAENQSTVTGK